MDRWNATSAAFQRLGFDPTGVRSGTAGLGGDPTGVRSSALGLGGDPTGVRSGLGNDPTGMRSMLAAYGGSDPLLDYGLKAFEAQNAKNAAAQNQFSNFWGSQSPQMGGSVSLGGDWAGVDRWNDAINAAAAKHGVPVGLIKAVMKLESGGDPNATGAPGVWGPMQVYGNVWGDGPWMHDPVANIDKGTEILKIMYAENGNNWREALRHYHGIGSDGYTTDQQYADIVLGNWDLYNSQAGGGTAGSGYSAGGTSGGLSSLFGNAPISYEFGVDSDLGYYDYGNQYGLNGLQHTGVDIAVPRGTAITAPMGGTITCSGTNNGPGADGGGCAAFADTDGGGVGRLELTLDNGVVLIFGHSGTASVRPGQRVNVGDVIGTSGGMNGAHVHLEARVPDPSMPSGYRIVDPRTILGGAGGMFSGGSSYYPMQPSSGYSGSTGGSMNDMMLRFLTQPGMSW